MVGLIDLAEIDADFRESAHPFTVDQGVTRQGISGKDILLTWSAGIFGTDPGNLCQSTPLFGPVHFGLTH